MKVCPACGSEYGDEAAFCSRDRAPLRLVTPGAVQGLMGQLVGDRYQVDARLGEGGMGEVYLATHVLMGRRCALKVMSPSLSRDPDAVSRFNREATNASRISHPNVCAVYDFGLTPDGLVYLAMEYLEGRTLTAVAEERGPMPVAAALELVAQCAAGLEAAHEMGIVHRDLKPDNIMVVWRGSRETVKLVDFGIAKAMEPEPAQRVTKTGFVVGTPEYMSPEQLAGDVLDGRSDQYSLALVLYRLITGGLPFEGTSIQETLVKRLTDPPKPLLISRPEGKFPEGLQAVMDRALSRYPADRYPSVSAFIEALRGVVTGVAGPTRPMVAAEALPATRPMHVASAPRRSRSAIAAVGVLIVAAGTWAVVHFSGAAPVPAPASTPTPPPRDTGHRTAAVPSPAPVPPPAPVPVSVPKSLAKKEAPLAKQDTVVVHDTVVAATEADTSTPDMRALNSPLLKSMEVGRWMRVLRNPRATNARKAMAAAFLGQVALQEQKHDTAVALFRMAYNWQRRPGLLKILRQLGDTVTP